MFPHLQFFMTTSFWVILHSIIWNGEIKKDDDLPFPFNQIARILKGDEIASIDLKEPVALNKDMNNILDTTSSNYYDGYISKENQISGSSLSEISLNNLYNFLTDPEIGASNLIISAAFVSIYHIQ